MAGDERGHRRHERKRGTSPKGAAPETISLTDRVCTPKMRMNDNVP